MQTFCKLLCFAGKCFPNIWYRFRKLGVCVRVQSRKRNVSQKVEVRCVQVIYDVKRGNDLPTTTMTTVSNNFVLSYDI